MSRSNRFRVFHVTSQGTREAARKGRGEKGKRITKTPHKVKFTLEPGNASAECLECDFKLAPSPKPRLVIYNAEMHGQITEVSCDQSGEKAIFDFITKIRAGTVRAKDL